MRMGRAHAEGAAARGFAGKATEAGEANPPVALSDACVRRIRELAAEDSTASRLRVSVEAGGCSGYQYHFEWEAEEGGEESSGDEDEDVLIERDGATVIVDKVSLAFLKGATVDFTEELIRSSFQIVDNPNSEAGCGCGASFVAKE